MKNFIQKISALVLGLIFFSGGFVQAQYLWLETFDDFENYVYTGLGVAYEVPEGWVQYDADGLPMADQVTGNVPNGYGWTVVEWDADAVGVAISASWFAAGVETADDWLVTPAIEIPGAGYALEWRSKSQDDDYWDDYEVYVTTGGTTQADLNALGPDNLIFATPPDTPGGGATSIGEPNEWTLHTIDLSAYEGQTINIVYRNISEDEFLLLIDYIGVLEPPSGIDAVLTADDVPIEYGIIQRSQTNPIGPFGAEVYNFSDAAIDEVTLTVYIDEVNDAGELIPVWSASATAPANVELLTAQTIEIPDMYMPTEVGFFAMYYQVTHSQSAVDLNPDNDFSNIYTFFVDEALYARDGAFLDPEIVTDFDGGYFPIDDLDAGTISTTGAMGTVYELLNCTTVDSISIYCFEPAGTISCDIYTFDSATNTIGEVVASSQEWEATWTADDNVPYVSIPMEGSVNLNAGHYFIAANDPSNGSLNLEVFNYYTTSGRSFFREGEDDWQTLGFTPVVRMVGTGSDIASVLFIESEGAGLTYDFTVAANGLVESLSWDFGDGTTGMGQSISHTFTEETYDVCVTGTLGESMIAECMSNSTITQCITIEASCALEVVVEATSMDASLFVTDASEPLMITWADANGNTILTDELTIIDLEEGVEYMVTVEDANGCINTQTFSTVACALEVGAPTINPSLGAVSFGESIITGEPSLYNWPEELNEEPTSNVIFDVPPGDYMMTIEDVNGCIIEVSFTMTEEVNMSIEDLSFVQNFSLAPNPANTKVTLNIDFENVTDLSYEIYTVTGQRLFVKSVGTVKTITETIDVSTFSNGIYFVQFSMNDKVYIEKLIVD